MNLNNRSDGVGLETHEEEAAFWLAISRVAHIGPVRIDRLMLRYGSLEAAWAAPVDDLRAVLEPRALAELVAARRHVDPETDLRKLSSVGTRVTYPGHPGYPRLLAEISGRPSILFVRGELVPADDAAVGIVGTRRASPYGRQVAERMASELAKAGVTVISGLARGVDAAAHRGALDAGGRTIAVLGSGVDVIYPSEHAKLAEQILSAGAIVSEQPPGAKPDARNFPARNRIISGMSVGVAVIEAPLRSGALITATFAADQGRDVFVVPGSVLAESSEGSNALLRDGARIVRDGNDILEDLDLGTRATPMSAQAQLQFTGDESRLYDAIHDDPKHIDELADETGLSLQTVSESLLIMELRGVIRNFGAQYYVRR